MATAADAEQFIMQKDIGWRRDPTLKNYEERLKAFVDKAKRNPSKDYLYIQSFSYQDYPIMGFRFVPNPYYCSIRKDYEIIPVESLVTGYTQNVPNAYFLVLFACCRGIKDL